MNPKIYYLNNSGSRLVLRPNPPQWFQAKFRDGWRYFKRRAKYYEPIGNALTLAAVSYEGQTTMCTPLNRWDADMLDALQTLARHFGAIQPKE